jgi:hypothetical protein
MRTSELQKEIQTSVVLANAIDDSTDIFGISGGGLNPPNHPLGTPLRTVVSVEEKVYECH